MGKSDVAHLCNLVVVLECLESVGTCLKQDKCPFMIAEVGYLCHRLLAKNINEKVSAVKYAKAKDVPQLCSFLGMVN